MTINNTNNNTPRPRRTRPRTAALVQGVNNQIAPQEVDDLNLDRIRLAEAARQRELNDIYRALRNDPLLQTRNT